MRPDPVLHDYLKEDLTYAENKAVAKQWQSREQEEIQQGQNLNVNMTTLQLSFFSPTWELCSGVQVLAKEK